MLSKSISQLILNRASAEFVQLGGTWRNLHINGKMGKCKIQRHHGKLIAREAVQREEDVFTWIIVVVMEDY